jgi:hypothetical protein
MGDAPENNNNEDSPEKGNEVELDQKMGAETFPNKEVIDVKTGQGRRSRCRDLMKRNV